MSYTNPEIVKAIKTRMKDGQAPIVSGRSSKLGKISFSDLVFVPAQLAKRPVDYFKEKISSKITIGKNSRYPIDLEMPIVIAAMSFGALSERAKIALAKASSIVGTMTNTGEGGMLPAERQFAKKLIVQYATGRFGVDENYLKNADAVEIKIGQGAKPGQGGLLPAKKVSQKIAQIRKIKIGEDCHSPASHPDIKNPEDLKNKVKWLRQITDGRPIIIKLAAGDIENDLKIAVFAEPDIIAIDGGTEGASAACPEVLRDEVGIPVLTALVRARKFLDSFKAKQELWVGGGFYQGGDIAKALALGADAVFLASALLVTLGCTSCGQCHKGFCPVGIATQEPSLEEKLDIEKASQQAANFLKSCNEEIKMVVGAVGENDVRNLKKEHLRSLNPVISQITGIPLV